MKQGNISLNKIEIPKLYYSKIYSKHPNTFDIPQGSFSERKLFKKFNDLNLSNSLRNNNKIYEEYNSKKYQPIHKISPVKYDFKDIKNEINVDQTNPALIINKKKYQNDEQKLKFSQKIIDLMRNVNDGDPKIEILMPISNESKDESHKSVQPVQRKNYNFEEIRGKVIIDFKLNRSEEMDKKFQKETNLKYNSIKNNLKKDKVMSKDVYYDKFLEIIRKKKTDFLIQKANEVKFRKLINYKNQQTKEILSGSEKLLDFPNKNSMSFLKKSSSGFEGDRLSFIFDSTRIRTEVAGDEDGDLSNNFKLPNYNYNSRKSGIFSQRYNSGYVLKPLENKIYFK